MKPYSTSIVLGRFQPLHVGHIKLIERALSLSDKVIIFIGYSGFTDLRHFIDPETVKQMIEKEFKDSLDKIHIKSIMDMAEDSKWALKLYGEVHALELNKKISKERICFLGCKKDIVFYSKTLPQWDIMLIPYNGIDATSIRKKFFLEDKLSDDLAEASKWILKCYKGNKLSSYSNLKESYTNFF